MSLDIRDLPKFNACPPTDARHLVRMLLGSRKKSQQSPRLIIKKLSIGGWMHWMHNTGDYDTDLKKSYTAIKEECQRLAEELDKRMDQLGAIENEMRSDS